MKKLFTLLSTCLFCQIAEAQPKTLSPDEAFRSYLAQDSIQDKVGAMLYSRHTKPYYAAAMKKLAPKDIESSFEVHYSLAEYFRREAQMDSALLEIRALIADGFSHYNSPDYFPPSRWYRVKPQIDSLFALQPHILKPYINQPLRTKILEMSHAHSLAQFALRTAINATEKAAAAKALDTLRQQYRPEVDALLAQYGGWLSDSLIGNTMGVWSILVGAQGKRYQIRGFEAAWKAAIKGDESWGGLCANYTSLHQEHAKQDTCPLLFIPTTSKGAVENFRFQAHALASIVHNLGFPQPMALDEEDIEQLNAQGFCLSNPIRIGIIQYPEEKPSEAKKYAKGLKQLTDYMLAHGVKAKYLTIVWEPIPASHVQQMDMLEGQKPRYWYQLYEKKK